MSDLHERMCIELRSIGRAHIADEIESLRARVGELEDECDRNASIRAEMAELRSFLYDHYSKIERLRVERD